jgi:antitoxin (DNA-binding transcriptional repressor) of toxin-antitoxin stability system
MEGAMARVEVSNDELRTVRDATRELGRLIERLESGEAEKFVLTKHGQMRAVVVSLDDFTAMRACQRAGDIPEAA